MVSTIDESTLELLAREILMLDETGQSLIPAYEKLIENGLEDRLEDDAARKDVIIVGAGIAGLLTGRILKNAGYNVTILEANDSRTGGRIKTFHSGAFSDPHQYGEAGAMRIPTTHPLVNKLIGVTGLSEKVQPFFNVDVNPHNATEKVFQTWLQANEIQARRVDYNSGNLPQEHRHMGFPKFGKFDNQTADQILAQALAEPLSWVNIDPTSEDFSKKAVEGWKRVISTFDEYSMLRYLREYFFKQGLSPIEAEGLIAYLGTLQNLTSRLFLSFIHSFVDTFYISSSASYIEIAGGNWQLPEKLAQELKDELVMEARAIEIQWSNSALGVTGPNAVHRGRPGVYVRTLNEPGTKRGKHRGYRGRLEREFTADFLVIAIPFSALRFMEVHPTFSFPKRRAIQELHYDSATKVLLEFNQRFWEWDEKEWARRLPDDYRGHASIGGGSITDGPNRFIYYPSHPVPGSEGGVILASYTWSDEANRWDSIPHEDRYNYALKGLTQIYGEGIKRFFTGYGQTQSWMEDYYAFGEAAVFSPGQMTSLHLHIGCPEENVFFAGEHTSLKHAWIEGALESAVRASLEVHKYAKEINSKE